MYESNLMQFRNSNRTESVNKIPLSSEHAGNLHKDWQHTNSTGILFLQILLLEQIPFLDTMD